MTPCHNTDPFYDYTKWQSYLPALMACAAATDGPVLEVGMGHYSTPLLHAYCRVAWRELISLEQDKTWFKRFQSIANDTHRMILGDYDKLVPDIAAAWTGLLSLIDNGHPTGNMSRVRNFTTLLPVSDYVVLHDYCDENESGIGPMLAKNPNIKYCVTDAYTPPTLVATMKPLLDIPKALLDLRC